jgi:hypothetical protein
MKIELRPLTVLIGNLVPPAVMLTARGLGFTMYVHPDARKHPAEHAAILEEIAVTVNAGAKVILVTYSPYVMSHLNNIISGETQAQANHLYLKTTNAFLKPEQVAAYDMHDHNNPKTLHGDPDYGIRWDSISDPSNEIQQIYFAIYEAKV